MNLLLSESKKYKAIISSFPTILTVSFCVKCFPKRIIFKLFCDSMLSIFVVFNSLLDRYSYLSISLEDKADILAVFSVRSSFFYF